MKHTIFLVIFQLLFCMQSLYAEQTNLNNAAKTAALIKYVQDHQNYTKNLDESIEQLTALCIKTRKEYVGNDVYTYTYVDPWAGFINIQSLYNCRQERKNLPRITEDEIDSFIQQGAQINEPDETGKTALNYAQSHALYNILRSHGANFQIEPFLYMHPWSISIALLASTIVIANVYSSGYFSHGRYITYNQNDESQSSLHHRDEEGRTPLMNYLIEQEEKLVQLRAQMNPIQYNANEEHAYFSGLVTYQKLLEDTQAQIKDMIQQGAALNIQDCYGKSLLNYCKTKQLYDDLRSAGAPFEFLPGAYFAQPLVTGSCIIALPIIMATLGISYLIDQSRMADDVFDTWYKNHYNINTKK